MPTDFDGPPVYDYLTKDKEGVNKDYMSNIWRDYQATFYQTLIQYINSYGFFLPHRTTAERDAIQKPVVGQMLYNTTIDLPQIYVSTGWKTFTLF